MDHGRRRTDTNRGSAIGRRRFNRALAGTGNVTFFDVPTGWKVSIYFDARKRPGFSSKVYPGIEEARFAAWRALLWFRAKIGGSPEVSTLWLDQILKGGEKLQIFFASKIVNEPLSTT